MKEPINAKARHYFITGFPNFTAVKLVQMLIQSDPLAFAHILVMEKFLPFAARLRERLPKPAQRRVELVAGDVTHLDLGMSGEELTRMTRKVTHILHLAAIWEFGVPRRFCEEVNVKGARFILDFARDCKKLERFAHFSTIFVSGRRRGVIREDEFDLGQEFKNPWEQTRFTSEKLVRLEMEKGLPATILRLGLIVGDSQTGEILKFDGPYLFLKLMLTTDLNLPLFLPGQCEGPSNLVPVDYAVSAALHILAQAESLGNTYHVTDPYPLMTRTVFEGVCAYLGRRPPTFGLPRSLYKAVYLIPQMQRFSGIPGEMFEYFNHKAVHNCSNALAALKGAGIVCPRFETYFPISIEYARDLLKQRIEKQEEEETIDPFDYGQKERHS
ncbi:MAG: epimerase [Myxococcales bacterium]|nr:MAG: epimerase [Myxococcales bacterium]